MKRIVILLVAVAVVALAGCRKDGGRQPVPETPSAVEIETPEPAEPIQSDVRREDVPFDQLFDIFSGFGSNIMTSKFAPQSVKDEIKPGLLDSYSGYREFNGNACNQLIYTFFNDGCTDGVQMGCWKYDADGHYLVLLAETGGCDVLSTKYIRAYDYDPAAKSAHEVSIPLNPAPTADDFNDVIRLAGCNDIAYVRKYMRDRVYNYVFSPEGLRIDLNAVDEWDVNGLCGFQLSYHWNWREFVRDASIPSPCIHFDGFALMKLGGPMPAVNLDDDPIGYTVRYSEGGNLWLIDRPDSRVLEIQLEGDNITSIEIFDSRYSLQESFYWTGRGRLAAGSRICDYFDFTAEGAPQVVLFHDGTVGINDENYDTRISFLTTMDDLSGEVPSVDPTEMVMTLSAPRFKPDATIKSILIEKAY